MLDVLIAVILGIVEGITEWLPISSTGHMILVEQFLHMSTSHEFNSMFRVVIQLGAILAVVVLYFPKLWPFCSPRDGWIKKDTWILWFKVLVAALTAAIIGLPFDDLLDNLFYIYQTVAVTLILYGVLFIVVENYNKNRRPRTRKLEALPWSTALLIGVFMILIGRPLSVFLCLLPFRKITMKSRLFVSWVGLRGAVPIIFATYPVVAGVEGSNIIFNIVFFITIVSLVVQGISISFFDRMLFHSILLEKSGYDFGLELHEEIDSFLSVMSITTEMLEEADTLKDMNLPKGTLVMIVKRGDEFLIPNGTLKLHVGDKLLLISEKSKEEVNESE